MMTMQISELFWELSYWSSSELNLKLLLLLTILLLREVDVCFYCTNKRLKFHFGADGQEKLIRKESR